MTAARDLLTLIDDSPRDDWPPRPREVRARIGDSGIEVWEAVRTFYEVDEDWARFRDCYDWLTEDQLRAALAYAEKHWDVIEPRIAENYAYVPAPFRDAIPARWR